MSKRVSVEDRLNKEAKESPRDTLFKPTDKSASEVKAPEAFKRQTYYVTEELTDALMMYKAFEDKDISVIVREALYAYIPEQYLEQAREKYRK